jgi:hypothetical protein
MELGLVGRAAATATELGSRFLIAGLLRTAVGDLSGAARAAPPLRRRSARGSERAMDSASRSAREKRQPKWLTRCRFFHFSRSTSSREYAAQIAQAAARNGATEGALPE